MKVADLINLLLELDQNKEILIAKDMTYHENIAVEEYPKKFMTFPNQDNFYYLETGYGK
ncbi:MAG: hypothetical protein WA131_09035 [Desulfitobacteriaceae bacterium]